VPIDLGALFEGRFTRPYDLEQPPRFLANPCESAPQIAAPAVAPASAAAAAPAITAAAATTATMASAATAAAPPSPLEVVRSLVAERTELPASAVGDDSRLLSDLHLNSITVAQLVVEASRRLGLRPPASATDYAQATVAEVAQALAERAAGESAGAGTASESAEGRQAPAGVAAWVRPFRIELVERPLLSAISATSALGAGELDAPAAAGRTGVWQVIASPGHGLASRIAAALAAATPASDSPAVLLCLPAGLDEPGELGESPAEILALFVDTARAATAAPAPSRCVVVQHGGGGGGFARTLHLELPAVATWVIDLPADADPETAAACVVREVTALAPTAATGATEIGGAGSYVEAHYDSRYIRRVPLLRPHLAAPAGAERLSLGPDDVLLATGGGKGIGAECALALARASGCRLAILGRSDPRQDPQLAENLARLAAAGVHPLYVRADVAFGSIIARTGLHGEAEYALANEWLALRLARYAASHPACRCLTLDWSVWSGTGMGDRLGTLEALVRQGLSPIPLDMGVAELQLLLADPTAAGSLVVTGRFGNPPTLQLERPDLPLLRFLETPRVSYPGIELVADAELSADTDPYLLDHIFHGEPLFAAVLGLEAMAQAAAAVAGSDSLPDFDHVELRRPVAVSAGRSTRIRLAALVRAPGVVEVALRDSSTGFAADHFRAVCRFPTAAGQTSPEAAATTPSPVTSALPEAPSTSASPALTAGQAGDTRLAIDPQHDLYRGMLFHQGRFQRLAGYRQLGATECLAEISPDGSARWFSRFLPPALLLGDPGARDAAIHGIQACIPHAQLLPASVEHIAIHRLAADEPLLLAARERHRHGDSFVYDLDILGADGTLRERWRGLELRAVGGLAPPAAWSAALLAPYLERRLQELLPDLRLRVALEPASRHSPAVGDAPAFPAAGGAVAAGGPPVASSRAAGLVLAVRGEAPGGLLGCGLAPLGERPPAAWREPLDGERLALAGLIARRRGGRRLAAVARRRLAGRHLRRRRPRGRRSLRLRLHSRHRRRHRRRRRHRGCACRGPWIYCSRIDTAVAPVAAFAAAAVPVAAAPAALAAVAAVATGPESA
jgi:enediyne polyketide synthase